MSVTRLPIRWPPWLALLKISKVPFWFIWITPVIFGYIASAQKIAPMHLGWFIVSVLCTCLLEAVNCIHNELVDQPEDRLNQPNRTALVASVGEASLRQIVYFGYGSCLLWLLAIAAFVSPVVATVMLLGGLMAPLYNWGPRLKRRPGWAELAIGWAAFAGYLWGWMWNQPLTEVPPVAWVAAYFFGITSFVKDLPDVKGDDAVNAGGIFSIRRAQLRRTLLLFIAISPYALVTALVALGFLPPPFLFLYFLSLAGLLVFVVSERAGSLNSMIVAYELAFTYVHLFFLAIFLLDTPTSVAFLSALGLFAGRIFTIWLRLAPRFVEPEFSWMSGLAELCRTKRVMT